jgi:polysaccharide biosynthesis transport protein
MATVTNFPSSGRGDRDSWGGPPQINEERSFDPRRIIGALLRRKLMIAAIMATGLGLSFVYANQLTPLYAANVMVLIEGNRNNVLNIENVAKGLTPDYYTNETQAAVIRSRDIAGKVVDKLELLKDPRFNPEIARPQASLWDITYNAVVGWLGGLLEFAGWPDAGDRNDDSSAGYSPQQMRIAQREMMIDIFLSGLSVIPSQRALLVEIEYVSSSPEIAANAANAVAEIYILDQLADKGSVTQKASKWLAQRATELRQRLIDSEKRLEKFRRKSGIMEVQGGSLFREQAAKLNIDLVTARTSRGEAAARYRQVQTLLKTGGIETAAAVLDSPLIQRLREQESTVLRKFGEMKTQVRAAHPRMTLVRNELKDVRSNIAAEVHRIVVNLGNELEIARVRERGFATELKRLESQIDTQNDSAVTLRTLQSEVHANKQLYETVISRFKETGVVGENLQQADAKTISPATVPGLPFYPQKSVMMAVAFFFATAIGIALAIVLEILDNGFRTLEQLEDITGMPTIGIVPKLSRQDRAKKPHQVVTEQPDSLIGESIRTIQTSLMLSGSHEQPNVILVTSSVPGEGKTSIALSMAGLSARTGNRSIAIDCDLRRASLHQTLEVSNDVGLSNYLSGQAEFEDIVQIDPASGLHYISAGARVAHPIDLLGSQRMYGLLQQLEATYDSVILDTPPLLAVSDALVLVRAVDRVVFVVRWETTRRESVIASVKQIAEAGAQIGGLVLSQVDLRKQAKYGYSSGTGYYYGDGTKYSS